MKKVRVQSSRDFQSGWNRDIKYIDICIPTRLVNVMIHKDTPLRCKISGIKKKILKGGLKCLD